jgi:hypothetical protein
MKFGTNKGIYFSLVLMLNWKDFQCVTIAATEAESAYKVPWLSLIGKLPWSQPLRSQSNTAALARTKNIRFGG